MFLKLTNSITNEAMGVNMNLVESIQKHEHGGSKLYMTNGGEGYYHVDEELGEIMSLIYLKERN